MEFRFKQKVGQLENRRGGDYYLKIDAEIINQFEKCRKTRLIGSIDDQLEYSCGLNHYGDGNFFFIVSTKNLKALGKDLGDSVKFTIREDPNPFGVEIPEVLSFLLAQDEDANKLFHAFSDGKKRSLIFATKDIKDIDRQVSKILDILNGVK